MLPLPLPLIRVLDLTTSAAGAAASRSLADFGAEVVVVERPCVSRDAMARFGRNKFSCVIDPSVPQGRDLLLRLAAGCHIVLKDGPDDALRDLDYGAFRGVREDVVLGVIAGGGEQPGIGEVAAGAVMTALFHVRFRGQGQEVTISSAAAENSMRTVPIVAAAKGATRLTPDLPCSGCYACSDGSIAIVVRSTEELATLCEVVGSPLPADAGVAELRVAVAGWTAGRDARPAAAELNQRGIPAQAVLSLADLRDDPQLRARGVFETVATRQGVFETDGPRIRFGDTPLHTRLATPEPGEHTGYVLRSLVGLSDAEIASLTSPGVVSGQS